MESSFTRVYGLNSSDSTLLIHHDYGEATFSWEDIQYVFGAKIKNEEGREAPVLIFSIKNLASMYYIDGLKISPKDFVFSDTKDPKAFDKSFLSLRPAELAEKKFTWIASEICSHRSASYVDKPVIECLKGSTFFLPTFNTLKDSVPYYQEALRTAKQAETSGAPISAGKEAKSVEISRPSTTRVEWSEGMVIDGAYTIQQVLRGGMGIVYIAFDPANTKFYALKTFQEKFLWDQKVINQFIKEAEIWIHLEKHPNIVQAEMVRMIEGKPFIFLEYVLGIDLHKFLKEGFIPLRRTLEMAIQFCNGMSYAFRKLGLIHRDIKPSNCMISKDGVLKITDFGLGKIFDECPMEDGLVEIPQKFQRISTGGHSSVAMAGTLPFMAPELFSDMKAAGVKTDIYSFGVLLYMMLTGINPFYTEDPSDIIVKHLTLKPSRPHKLNAAVPPELSQIVMRCIEKDPEARYGDFDGVKGDLEKIYEENYGNYEHPSEAEVTFSEDDWIKKGRSLASIDRHRVAIVAFDQALKIDPGATVAKIEKARALLKLGAVDEALYQIDEMISQNPSSWEAWFLRGEAKKLRKDPEEALIAFEKALELEPTRPETMGKMGTLLGEMGKYENALFCFDWALEKNPKLEDLWVGKGEILLNLYKFEEASKCFDGAIEINPRHFSAWSRRGETLFRRGFFSEATEAFKMALTLNPESIQERLRIASCHAELGDERRALLTYDQALKIKKTDIEIYLAKAGLQQDLNLYQEAMTTLSKGEVIAPGDEKILLQKAILCSKTGDHERTLSLCDSIPDDSEIAWEFDLLKKSAISWINRKKQMLASLAVVRPLEKELIYRDFSSLLSVFCDIDDALAHLRAELELKEDARKLHFAALLCKIKGQFAEARDLAARAAALAGDPREARDLVQEIEKASRIGMGQEKRKKGILGSIINKDLIFEKNPEKLLMAGLEKFRRDQFQEALDLMKGALQKKPDMAAALFYSALAHEKLGDRQSADRHMSAFIEKCPDSPGFLKYRLTCGVEDLTAAAREELFHKWIALMPLDPEPWVSYIGFLADSNRMEEARIIAGEASRKFVNRWNISKRKARFWHLRGILELISGITRKAYYFFEKGLKLDPHDPVSLLGLAACYAPRENESLALKTYERLSDEKSCELSILYQSACLHMKHKRKKEAIELIDRALERKPDSSILNYKKAQIYLDFNDYTGFWNYCYSIHDLDTRYIPFCSLRTRALVGTDRISEAMTYIRGALNNNPENPLLLDTIASLHLKTDMYERANEVFDQIISSGIPRNECFLGKGIAYYSIGRYQYALTDFETYLSLRPNNPVVYTCMGATYFHLRDFDKALLFLKKPIEMKYRFANAWVNLAIYMCLRGAHMLALRYADRALRIDQDNFNAWICRSRALQGEGDFEEAYKSVEKALSHSPLDLCGWIQRGVVEFRMGEYKKSAESFAKACEIDDRQPTVWYNRGAAALCYGEETEAEECLDHAIELAPSLYLAVLAKAILGRIENDQQAYVEAKNRALEINPVEFQKWYDEFSLLKGSSLRDSVKLYEEIPLSFELPEYPAFEIDEPVNAVHYLKLDEIF